ncbi:MAG: hypothetical protein IPM79_19120 [Polyangiaceae bacterium]|nr:hypothetical protein [Polyangiaceae bacterium]
MPAPTPDDVARFYRAAALGLRFMEQREGRGRRFGEGALAGWRALGGALTTGDRLDLLVRDAAAMSPLAFSPQQVFELGSLAGDEPFGPDWAEPAESLAAACLKEAAVSEPLSWNELLVQAARVWGVEAAPESAELAAGLAKVTPASYVFCAGFGALFALASLAHERAGLDLGQQVRLLVSRPAERQLFGLVLLATGTAAPRAKLLHGERFVSEAKPMELPEPAVVLSSADAYAPDLAAITEIALELGEREC